jgi:hypothetical protein
MACRVTRPSALAVAVEGEERWGCKGAWVMSSRRIEDTRFGTDEIIASEVLVSSVADPRGVRLSVSRRFGMSGRGMRWVSWTYLW